MRYALPLSVLLAAASAAPCVADELSFNDLGPWASGVLSQQLRAAERHMPRGPASSSLPKSGAASYSGVTLGKADVTPSATNVTAHDLLKGKITLDVDFGTQTLGGTLVNLQAIDPRTHARTQLIQLNITNSPAPGFSGNSFKAAVSTFSPLFPVGGSLTGRFLGPGAGLTAGQWQASGRIPFGPTQTSPSPCRCAPDSLRGANRNGAVVRGDTSGAGDG